MVCYIYIQWNSYEEKIIKGNEARKIFNNIWIKKYILKKAEVACVSGFIRPISYSAPF